MNVGMKELEQDTNVTIDCKILIFLTHDYKSMHLFILTDTDRCVVSNNAVYTTYECEPTFGCPVCHDY